MFVWFYHMVNLFYHMVAEGDHMVFCIYHMAPAADHMVNDAHRVVGPVCHMVKWERDMVISSGIRVVAGVHAEIIFSLMPVIYIMIPAFHYPVPGKVATRIANQINVSARLLPM